MSMAPSLSIIIPAHNEAEWIGACLTALLNSQGQLPAAQILVVANACSDQTVAIANTQRVEPGCWTLEVIETQKPGKLNALNLGDRHATGDIRVYLDADVQVSPKAIAQIASVLSGSGALYATATPKIARAASRTSRAYARFWSHLPFVGQGTPGFGLFAVNAEGRKRWEDWPDIIADDMFARLNFTPEERIKVAASYEWPLVEGMVNLIRVRRRQNAGVRELERLFPALMQNEDKPAVSVGQLLKMACHDPVGFAVYASVALGVRSPLFATQNTWARGR